MLWQNGAVRIGRARTIGRPWIWALPDDGEVEGLQKLKFMQVFIDVENPAIYSCIC
jgi:hypothetical protein